MSNPWRALVTAASQLAARDERQPAEAGDTPAHRHHVATLSCRISAKSPCDGSVFAKHPPAQTHSDRRISLGTDRLGARNSRCANDQARAARRAKTRPVTRRPVIRSSRGDCGWTATDDSPPTGRDANDNYQYDRSTRVASSPGIQAFRFGRIPASAIAFGDGRRDSKSHLAANEHWHRPFRHGIGNEGPW